MINEEIVDNILDVLDECEQKIQSLKKMIIYAEKKITYIDNKYIIESLKSSLTRKYGDYRLIQERLCFEYEKLEIETIKTHLHG